MSMSLHLYHCVAPWFAKGLTFQDYLHHFLFAFFLFGSPEAVEGNETEYGHLGAG